MIMRMISWILLVSLVVAVFALSGTRAVYAQGDETISTSVIDSETFITVKETTGGDLLSLYKIKGDRIILVDSVFNTSNRDSNLPKRYLHRLDVDNR